jgi:hypothetical protein
MTEPLSVSVIVVSRGRPALLQRCLTGLGQLFHPKFEIVVVADPPGCESVTQMGWADRIKLIEFDEANISKARNLGIAASGGEVVAFIDDDAVPEPTWLTYLAEPFAAPDVAQTGGTVLGRNGITRQWPVRAVDALGATRTLEEPGRLPFRPDVAVGEAVKTEGTNMAFRRDVITRSGGFDSAFAFYLDETDVNYRLRDHETVVVPLAQVHHGFAGSARRQAHRGPTDLTQIGASTAIYLRKHTAPESHEFGKNRAYSEQKRRLLSHMIQGTLSPDRIRPLMRTLEQGFVQGEAIDLRDPRPITDAVPFQQFEARTDGASIWFAGRPWRLNALRENARRAASGNRVATVICLSPTVLAHRVAFHPAGYWEQRGGLFGRSVRSQPLFRWTTFPSRVREEQARVSEVRNHWADRPIDG